MTDTPEQRALRACLDYDRWKREEARLTKAISDMQCPNEVRYSMGESCFSDIRTGGLPVTPGLPQNGDRAILLHEIREAVSACPECVQLCDLITERRHARQRIGVAKRAMRRAARLHASQATESTDQ